MVSFVTILANVAVAGMAIALGGAWFGQMHLARELHIAYRFGEVVQRECGKEYLENETAMNHLYHALREKYSQIETSASYVNLLFSITFLTMVVLICKILLDSKRTLSLFVFLFGSIMYFFLSRDAYRTLLGTPFPGQFYVSTPLPEDYVDRTHIGQLKVFGVQLLMVLFLVYVAWPLQKPDTETGKLPYDGTSLDDIHTQLGFGLGLLICMMLFAILIVKPTYDLNNNVLVEYDEYLKRLAAPVERLPSDEIVPEIKSNYFRKNEKAPVGSDAQIKARVEYLMHRKGKELDFIQNSKVGVNTVREIMYDLRARAPGIGDRAMDYPRWVAGISGLILVFLLYVVYHVGYKQSEARTVVFVSSATLFATFVLTWVGWFYVAMM